MKRLILATAVFSVSLLAIWAIFQITAASLSKMRSDNVDGQVQSAVDGASTVGVSGEKAAHVTDVERKVAPVFDTSGAVVSNPSGIEFNPVSSGDRKIAPVFDVAGTVVSDPSGVILNADRP